MGIKTRLEADRFLKKFPYMSDAISLDVSNAFRSYELKLVHFDKLPNILTEKDFK